MGEITKDDKKPYLKFTPFYKKSILKKPRSLFTNKTFNFIKDDKSLLSLDFIRPKPNKFILVNGGRKNALIILQQLKTGKFNNYDTERDYPYSGGNGGSGIVIIKYKFQ